MYPLFKLIIREFLLASVNCQLSVYQASDVSRKKRNDLKSQKHP